MGLMRSFFSLRLSLLRKQAERGDATAQCLLGDDYYNGEGVPQDYAEAAKWFRLAAEQGHARAQNNLGVMYDYGSGAGVPQDSKETVKWYRRAAEQGNAGAQYGLGLAYREGRGVPQDFVQAYAWFNISAGNGHQAAAEARLVLLNEMTPAQIEAGQRFAREYAAKFGAK